MAEILSAIVSGLFGLLFCLAIWGLFKFIALLRKVNNNIEALLDVRDLVQQGAVRAGQARHLAVTGEPQIGTRRT